MREETEVEVDMRIGQDEYFDFGFQPVNCSVAVCPNQCFSRCSHWQCSLWGDRFEKVAGALMMELFRIVYITLQLLF